VTAVTISIKFFNDSVVTRRGTTVRHALADQRIEGSRLPAN
jgi:hypothetical protein